jgi:hypothetical protein
MRYFIPEASLARHGCARRLKARARQLRSDVVGTADYSRAQKDERLDGEESRW